MSSVSLRPHTVCQVESHTKPTKNQRVQTEQVGALHGGGMLAGFHTQESSRQYLQARSLSNHPVPWSCKKSDSKCDCLHDRRAHGRAEVLSLYVSQRSHIGAQAILLSSLYIVYSEILAGTSSRGASVATPAEITKPRAPHLHPRMCDCPSLPESHLKTRPSASMQDPKANRPWAEGLWWHPGQHWVPPHSHRRDPGTADYCPHGAPWPEWLGFLLSTGFHSCFFSVLHHINTNRKIICLVDFFFLLKQNKSKTQSSLQSQTVLSWGRWRRSGCHSRDCVCVGGGAVRGETS